MDWDMQRIYEWTTNMILALRNEVAPPATDTASVIGDYLNRHMQNILVVNDVADMRSNMEVYPVMQPKGELLVRFEPDTKQMYIAAKHFKNDCVDYQINYKETLEALKKDGVYLGTSVKRLSKGMKFTYPGVYCLMFDTSAANFLDVQELVGVDPEATEAGEEEADAGGGS
jgi:hypothetical protein